jgi:hypothetical protein
MPILTIDSDSLTIDGEALTIGHTIGLGDEIAWLCPSLDDTNNGTSTLEDFGTGDNDGTLVTGTYGSLSWAADTASGGVRCIDFTPDYGYISLANDNAQPSSWSTSGWFYIRSSSSRTCLQFFGGDTTKDQRIDLTSAGLLRAVSYKTSSDDNVSTTAIDQDEWLHIAVVRDSVAATLSIYIDGTLAASTAITGTIGYGPGSQSRFIGYDFFTGEVADFKGDDWRWFNRAITVDEIGHLATGRAVLGAPGANVDVDMEDWTLAATGVSSVGASFESELTWTLSAEGIAHVYGIAAPTLDDWTLSAEAFKPEQSGAVDATLDDWTLESEAVTTNTASLAIALDDWSIASVGVSRVEAELDATVSWSLTAAAQYGDGYIAALDATLDDWSLAAEATHNVAGGLLVVLDDWTVQATAQVRSRKPRRLFASQLHASSLFGG